MIKHASSYWTIFTLLGLLIASAAVTYRFRVVVIAALALIGLARLISELQQSLTAKAASNLSHQ